jgi:hypothetical protein
MAKRLRTWPMAGAVRRQIARHSMAGWIGNLGRQSAAVQYGRIDIGKGYSWRLHHA